VEYINGSPVTLVFSGTVPATAPTNSAPFVVAPLDASRIDARMDELRLSAGIARSPAWVATEYRNQNAPGSFFTLGAQQSQSVAPETISTPSISGPASASPGTIYPYTASGAVSSLGHPLQYLFSWGDGTTSTWNLSAGASHAWMAAGTYTVTVQARCSIDTGIVSAISSPLAVTVIGVSAAATPIFNPPAGLYSTSQTVSIT
jgi:hypothetical protein